MKKYRILALTLSLAFSTAAHASPGSVSCTASGSIRGIVSIQAKNVINQDDIAQHVIANVTSRNLVGWKSTTSVFTGIGDVRLGFDVDQTYELENAYRKSVVLEGNQLIDRKYCNFNDGKDCQYEDQVIDLRSETIDCQ